MAEPGRAWSECLDLVKIGQTSPIEILYSRPFKLPIVNSPFSPEQMEKKYLSDYVRKMLNDKELKMSSQVPDEPLCHQEGVSLVKPGDWALIKVIKCCSSPRWEGPFQFLLTTTIAVKLSEKPLWIHLLHCKKQVLLTSTSTDCGGSLTNKGG